MSYENIRHSTFLFCSSSMADFRMGYSCVAALTNDVTHRQYLLYFFKILLSESFYQHIQLLHD